VVMYIPRTLLQIWPSFAFSLGPLLLRDQPLMAQARACEIFLQIFLQIFLHHRVSQPGEC